MKMRSLEYLNSDAKRSLDLLGGLAIGAMLIPAGALAAVVSELDNRSLNPFFKQSRVGKDSLPFDVIKLRTIPKNSSSDEVRTYGTYDPRASRVGMAMREIGIDEMPQIVNVLKGEMSLVGLRPLVSEDLDRLEDIDSRLFKRWHSVYESVKPGLTGPSQILRHQYKVTTDEIWRRAMELDLDYAKKASLAYDLRLLGSTPLKLLNARVNLVNNAEADEALNVPDFSVESARPAISID